MIVEEMLDRMSAREFAEWCYLLSGELPAVEQPDVEDQLRKVFGRPRIQG
jgi:hypothetical protein